MEKSANSETKKCPQNHSNTNNCRIKTKEERSSAQTTNCSESKTSEADNNQVKQAEDKKRGKWRVKLSRFCQNKPEKKETPEPEKTDSEKVALLPSITTSGRNALLKELFPEIKDFNKLTESQLNREIIEQRLRILKKSYTLPPQLNAGQRSQKQILFQKMEILTENDHSPNKISPMALGNIPNGTKNSANQAKRNDNKQDEYIPQVTVTKQTTSSPRMGCMISVCPSHDGRHGGEALEAALYCGACMQSVCYKCAFEKHKDHKVSPIQVAAENIRISLAERKRKIENSISQMRTKRKSVEASNEELQQQIHAQFEQVIQRLKKKEADVMEEVGKMTQKRINLIHGIQNQQETAWGQIDAVLKTQDDAKMLEEYNGLSVIEFNIPDNMSCSSFSPLENGGNFLHKRDTRSMVDLNRVQDEIEKVCLAGPDLDSSLDSYNECVSNGVSPRQSNKRFNFKLDLSTAHTALRLSTNQASVEFVGSERNGVNIKHAVSSFTTGHPYNAKYPRIPNGLTTGKIKRTQFATVLGDSSITQGKQYWEVSVNRSMEYRLGVAYKHMQGTKTLADEHNCWALCLTYPDRFAAIHKHHKDYIFVPTHSAVQTSKVIRIGIFLDYERGVLSFYNASLAAEKKHLYTFRTFFNRPVWPLLSLRQGKLQILTGLPVPRNLVWKTR